MGTIAENLLELQQTKENFKTAFAEKEVDLTGVPFTEYPNKFSEIKTSENLNTELTEQETLLAELESQVDELQEAPEAPRMDGEYFVKVIDYDGTILKEEWLNTGDTFTLPKPPSHDGLVFQEWSCSQDIVDNVITIEDNNVMVGAIYTTSSGLNEFDIELTKVTGLDVTLNIDGTKDWGDGTSDDLTTHAYTNYGNYTIKCNGTTMTTSGSGGLFGQTMSLVNYYLINVRLASVIGLGNYVFTHCMSLKTITISNSLTYFYNSVFVNCCSLISVVMPHSIVNYGDFSTNFNSCYSLTNIVMPNTVTTVGQNMFMNCYSLTNIVIPNSVTSILSKAFYYCYSLTNIIIPNKVTRIGNSAFTSCYSLTAYDFSTHTVVPSLSNKSAFSGINAIAKIIVPDALYDEWIVATNWSIYADYIYKASEVQL